MPTNNIEEIQKEVRLLVENLGKFQGGLIGEIYSFEEEAAVSECSIEAERKAFRDFG